MSASDIRRRSPYQGLIPYEEADAPFFFGREKETRLIIANLFASPLTLLYGASGVGKSSALRAGVANQLRGRDELLVLVFNLWQSNPVADLKNKIVEKAGSLDPRFVPPTDSANLAEYLAKCAERLDRRLMIILDQFEEYFLYHPKEDEFATEFSRAVTQSGSPVSFLISIREDFYAKLDRFEGRIPTLYDNYLRIEHLDRRAARVAIESPLAEYNRHYTSNGRFSIEPDLVDAVLRQVETGRVVIGEAGRGVVETAESAEGAARIETPFLQLVMTRLWEKEQSDGSSQLRLNTLKDLGGAENIVRTHLDAVITKLSDREQEIAASVFHYLVTPSGTKIAYTASDLASSAELEEAEVVGLLKRLSFGDVRILRTVEPSPDRPTSPRYEIFHDVLAPAILTWRTAYVQKQEKAETERQLAAEAEERIRAERQLARERSLARRLRWALVGLGVLMIAMGGLTVYAFRKQRAAGIAQAEAVKQRIFAENAKREVVSQRDAAEKAAADATKQRNVAQAANAKAQVAADVADKAKGEAEEQRQAAERSKVDALAQRDAANRSKAIAEEERQRAEDLRDRAEQAVDRATQLKIKADAERDRADRQAREASFASSNLLAVQASDISETYPQLSLLLAVEALKTAQQGKLRVPAAEETLQKVLAQTGGRVLNHKAAVNDVALSQDSRLLVSVNRTDKTAHIWDLTAANAAAAPHVLKGVGGPIAVSSTGRWLVSGSLTTEVGDNWAEHDVGVEKIRSGEMVSAKLWDLRSPNPTAKPLLNGTEPIYAMALSPKGRWLVTLSNDATHLWDLDAADPTAKSTNLTPRNNRIAVISPDGHWLVTESPTEESDISLWDLSAKNPAARSWPLGGPARQWPMNKIVFSPDGQWLMTGSSRCTRYAKHDNTARLWNLQTINSGAAPVPAHVLTTAGPVSTAVFSDNSQILVTGSSGNIGDVVTCADYDTVMVWDLTKPASSLRNINNGGRVVAISENKYLMTVAEDEDFRNRGGSVRIWDLEKADSRPVALRDRDRVVSVNRTVVSPDRRWLLTFSNDYLRAWDLRNFQPGVVPVILSGHEGTLTSLVFGADGHTIITGGSDKTARVWDLTSGSPFAGTYPLILGRGSYFLSPDQHLLATVESSNVRIWNLTDKDPTARRITLSGHSKDVNDVQFSKDNRWVVTGSDDNTARRWDLTAVEPSATARTLPGQTDRVVRVAISQDNRWLITGSLYAVHIWDLTTSSQTPRWILSAKDKNSDRNQAIYRFNLSPDSRWLITSGEGEAVNRVWSLNGTNKTPTSYPLGQVKESRVSPDGQWLVVLNAEGITRLMSLKEEDPPSTSCNLQGVSRDDSLDFDANSRWLFTGSLSHAPRLWNLTTNPCSSFIDLPDGHAKPINEVAFSPDGRWLATGSYDEKVRLWNLQSPDAKPAVLQGHNYGINAVRISADSRWMITTAKDAARLWFLTDPSVAESSILLPIEGSLHVADIVTDGLSSHWLIIGNYDDKTVSLWGTRSDGLFERACRAAGRNLTPEEWKKYFPGQRYRGTCEDLPISVGVMRR